jgi:hypothetical protein
MKRSAPLRRTPLDRGTSRLTRKTRLRAKAPRRLGTAQDDPAYRAFVRRLPCCGEREGWAVVTTPTPPLDMRLVAKHGGRLPKVAITTCAICWKHQEMVPARTRAAS